MYAQRKKQAFWVDYLLVLLKYECWESNYIQYLAAIIIRVIWISAWYMKIVTFLSLILANEGLGLIVTRQSGQHKNPVLRYRGIDFFCDYSRDK